MGSGKAAQAKYQKAVLFGHDIVRRRWQFRKVSSVCTSVANFVLSGRHVHMFYAILNCNDKNNSRMDVSCSLAEFSALINYAPSLQATRAETRLTVYRAHTSQK